MNRPVLTHEQKLAVFNDLSNLPNLSVEEKYWVGILKKCLERGDFHDTWGRLKVAVPRVADLIYSVIAKARGNNDLMRKYA